MMKTALLAHRLSAAVVAILPVLSSIAACAQPLDRDVAKLSRSRIGEEVTPGEIDEQTALLIKAHTSDEEQGRIYASAAFAYAQSAKKDPGKIMEYAELALDRPVPTLTRLKLRIAWGDAVQIANAGKLGADFAAARTGAARIYITGLKDANDAGIPPVAPPIPSMRLRHYITDDSAKRLEAEEQDRREFDACMAAKAQGEMVSFRQILARQVTALYATPPYDTDGLRALAGGILRDAGEVDSLIASVNEAIASRTTNAMQSVAK
jgi:hypothetical protein